MVQEKYAVRLPSEDRDHLERLIRSGQRRHGWARILLKTEGWSASQVAAALDTSPRSRPHQTAVRPRPSPSHRYRTTMIAVASDAPEGHDRWTLRLLADKVVELGLVQSLSYETVRLKLKKTSSSRGKSSSGASPR